MEFKRLTSTDTETYEKAMKLYAVSFPKHEQRDAAAQEAIMSNDDYHFDCIYNGGNWVGLILYWETEDFIYIDHFCILPEMRNKQLGQKALEYLASRTDKKIILEIDPPVRNIAIMRKEFYERCGYKRNPFPHEHPAYHVGEKPFRLVIMSYPAILEQKEYEAFNDYLVKRVMRQ